MGHLLYCRVKSIISNNPLFLVEIFFNLLRLLRDDL